MRQCHYFATLCVMVIDGKQIAHELKQSLRKQYQQAFRRPTLGVIVVQETPEIRRFVALKQQYGKDIGVDVNILRPSFLKKDTEHLLQLVLHSTRDNDGLILQLPLPPQYSLDMVLNLFPLSHDVDVIGQTAFQQHKEHTLPFMPPVVGAMSEILHRQGIRLAGRSVLVVGEGRLVGAPAVPWAQQLGGKVTVTNKDTPELATHSKNADIIILGAGVPGLLKPDMVKEGVIILDAGTSEEGGVLRGDADPACAEKATVFTPTPGGVGPITVAKIFENLLTLVRIKEARERE